MKYIVYSILLVGGGVGLLLMKPDAMPLPANTPSHTLGSQYSEQGLSSRKEIPTIRQNQNVTQSNNHIYSDAEKVNVWITKVNQWVADFPFPQETTHSIESANSSDIQRALQTFRQQLLNEIVNNDKLSKEDKSRILWGVYANTTWVGQDNALKAIVQDYLASVAPFEVVNDIRTTYQEWTSNGNAYDGRHDLLELADAILSVDEQTLNVQAKQQYVESIASTKTLLLDQIRNTSSNTEAQNLTGFAIDLYLTHASINDMSEFVSTIQSLASTQPDSALQLYHSSWKNILSRPEISEQATQLMLASPSPEVNQSLAFLLKEDGNIAIADINPATRSELLNYFISQKSVVVGTALEPDWKISLQRLGGVK